MAGWEMKHIEQHLKPPNQKPNIYTMGFHGEVYDVYGIS